MFVAYLKLPFCAIRRDSGLSHDAHHLGMKRKLTFSGAVIEPDDVCADQFSRWGFQGPVTTNATKQFSLRSVSIIWRGSLPLHRHYCRRPRKGGASRQPE